MDKYTKPNFNTSALITIDTQNDCTLVGAPAYFSGTLEAIPQMVQLLDSYRNKGRLIIHAIRLYSNDGANADLCRKQIIENGKEILSPNSHGAELVQEIKPNETISLSPNILLSGKLQKIGNNEFVMYKPRWGAFYKTPLEVALKRNGIDTLVFSGCNFPNCPRASIYEASERDYRIVLAKDAISQLYSKGEEEMDNIGVNLLTTKEINESLA